MNKKAICDAVVSQMLNDKEEALRNLYGLKDALNAESRSTAGDKHETGRAMIHREIQQVESTLKRVEEAIESMLRIKQSKQKPNRVAAGVLVETDGPWVLVGVAFGRLELTTCEIVCVSPEAPLAQAWHGCVVGDEVNIGSKTWTIKALH